MTEQRKSFDQLFINIQFIHTKEFRLDIGFNTFLAYGRTIYLPILTLKNLHSATADEGSSLKQAKPWQHSPWSNCGARHVPPLLRQKSVDSVSIGWSKENIIQNIIIGNELDFRKNHCILETTARIATDAIINKAMVRVNLILNDCSGRKELSVSSTW